MINVSRGPRISLIIPHRNDINSIPSFLLELIDSVKERNCVKLSCMREGEAPVSPVSLAIYECVLKGTTRITEIEVPSGTESVLFYILNN